MSAKEEEIYNAIDNGTYKFALQQCSKLLKKSPNVTFYQVLYNYILLESGKSSECLENCLKIMEKPPNDIKSLGLLNKIFSQLGKTEESFQVYENAAKKYPSFEILTHWFHLGCETNNVRVLQKSSMALKSLNSSNRLFHLWAAFTSYLLSISKEATAIEKTVIPKLGTKIVEALKPLRSEQEVYILVKLLESIGNFESVVSEILNFTGSNKLDLELQIILLKTLDKLEKYEELYHWSLVILNDYKLDDFNTWKYLIKSSLKLNKDVENMIKFYGTRNSRLALIELAVQRGESVDQSVYQYLNHIGCKPCAFFDIKSYFKYVDREAFKKWLDNNEILFSNEDRDMIWQVNVIKFKLLINIDLLDKDSFFDELIIKFNKYKHLLNKKEKTDFHQGDEFIVLVIQALLSKNFSTKNIIISILILEKILEKDKHEFHLRIWLVQLYKLINCHTQASLNFEKLKVKNIQFDILSHFLVSRLSSSYPDYDVLNRVFKIYKANKSETSYFIKIGFNKGSFNKLESMLEFHWRLENSSLKNHELLQYNKISRLLNNKEPLNEISDFGFSESYSDNRDFKVFWNTGVDEEILPLKEKLLANIPTDPQYDKIINLQEGLINGKITNIENADLSLLTDIEKWSFRLIYETTQLFNKRSSIARVSEIYRSKPKLELNLSWKVSHVLLVILDTAKSIQHIISNSYNKISKNDILNLKELNSRLIEKVRDEDILNAKQATVAELGKLKSQLKTSELLSKLGINSTHIDDVFDIINFSNNESFKLMKLL
ncbi:hypothetical protein WICMUC_003648 [Wickerhamomyces mucosus]|uniref:Uncharacterized protein n=1 Tax=Wickerhamomyces mucosus TaxID=1378264 RepID=A0A9P8PK76_9ASCO|nr:hypothetical protein WICMUC_003648 [Wickerhamomyces mucosus]